MADMHADRTRSNERGGPPPRAARTARHAPVALFAAGIAVAMVGASFAAVPLYRLFCQITGYGGTTQRAERASDMVLDRTMIVRFDANVARALAWRFQPGQRQVEVRIGETGLAFYSAANLTARSIKGTATFNVTPEAVGAYFNKIECFCFTEQELAAGQKVDMPVTFFIDPRIVDDPDARGIREVTLSYTFFPVDERTSGLAPSRQPRGGS
jgi:cytochrome c oxidase assembly protein subunit 11